MKDDSHKLYYNINEAAARYGFDASKLRYWESVFPMLKPEKRGGDRIYTLADLEILDEIVYLVEHKKHKLSAARQIMESDRSQRSKIKRAIQQLEVVKRYLQDVKELLK
ncbi:MerR family transcriptional regulator [Runella rosea]|uniref:MerR family transcriptional regulator n=1 Tax=Runella rosea TaxID=2259595 RepID=A0A344TQC9_9BACT|nr:MerR family transcriptional regulator [Runella rosea]AXE20850.1 MerR family transcriptional regulator [Runella rosea]